MELNNYEVTAFDTHAMRIDGDDSRENRWHQIIRIVDLRKDPVLKNGIVLLGFAVEEGVRRNHGRPGASTGPACLRDVLINLPAGELTKGALIDAGTIRCPAGDLEQSQQQLARCVAYIISNGGFPIVLGGGHEISYGHFQGVKKVRDGKTGIINFDAHFDLRTPKPAGNSGTSFYQIAMDEQRTGGSYHYLAIGIQSISNTQLLFDRAQTLNVRWISRDKFHPMYATKNDEVLKRFLAEIDHLYLTVDMDVFAAAFAPGVSAPAFNGIIPDAYFLAVFDALINSKKLVSMDLAEFNPAFDRDMCTARFAAELIFRAVQSKHTQIKTGL